MKRSVETNKSIGAFIQINWPPLLVKVIPTAGTGVTGKVDRTVRTDGRFQVTYNGMPLYFWKSDIKPGDTTGNGVNGIWSVVTP